MFAVHKYPIGSFGIFNIGLPKGAKILHVDQQNNHPHIWALVDTTTEWMEKRRIAVVCTGDKSAELENAKHIGTVLMENGSFVVHVFEL